MQNSVFQNRKKKKNPNLTAFYSFDSMYPQESGGGC